MVLQLTTQCWINIFLSIHCCCLSSSSGRSQLIHYLPLPPPPPPPPLLPTSDPIYRCFLPSPHLTTTTQQPSPPLPPPAKLAGPLQSLSVRIFHSFFFADFEYSNTLRIFLCGVAELGWDYYTISELSRRGRCRGGESCFLPTSSRRVYILYIE